MSLIEKYYNDFHSLLATKYEAEQFFLDRDLIALHAVEGKDKLLEVGCGAGRLLEIARCNEKHGVDISEIAVAEATRRGVLAKKVNIDDSDLPYPDKYFDAVLLIETLEHLFDPVHALAEANRVLQIGGIVVVSVPNIGYLSCRIALCFGRFTDFHGSGLIVDEHIRFYTRNSLKYLLSKTGFRIREVIGCHKGGVNPGADYRQVMRRPSLRRSIAEMVRIGKLKRQKVESLIHLLDRHISRALPSLAKGLVVVGTKDGEAPYTHNAPVDFLAEPKDYMTHFQRG